MLYSDPAGTYAVRDGDGRQGRDTSAATCFQKGGLWDAVARTCYVFGQEIPLQRYTRSPQPADATHECIGNPLAVELQIPLTGGGTAPVCLNAPTTELNPAYFHRPRKPKPLNIIEQILTTCGIRLAAAAQDEEDDEEDNIGLSNSGTPPTIGNSRSELKNVYNRKTDSPNWPQGFTQVDESIRVKVKNEALLNQLRDIEPGKWMKIYENGYLSDGSMASIHYFRSPRGKIFNLKVKFGWS